MEPYVSRLWRRASPSTRQISQYVGTRFFGLNVSAASGAGETPTFPPTNAFAQSPVRGPERCSRSWEDLDNTPGPVRAGGFVRLWVRKSGGRAVRTLGAPGLCGQSLDQRYSSGRTRSGIRSQKSVKPSNLAQQVMMPENYAASHNVQYIQPVGSLLDIFCLQIPVLSLFTGATPFRPVKFRICFAKRCRMRSLVHQETETYRAFRR